MSDWRDEPATDRQRAFANRLGIPLPEIMTKSEASARISEAVERRKRREENYTIRGNHSGSILDRWADWGSSLLTKVITVIAMVMVLMGVLAITMKAMVVGVVIIMLAAMVFYGGVRWKNRKGHFPTGDYIHAEPEPVHALPGTFDRSMFEHPQTRRFQFPRYKHDKRFLVRITDNTHYRNFWEGFDAEEKRGYTFADFEEDISGGQAEVEVESFRELFYKKPIHHLAPLKCLHAQWGVVEKIIAAGEDWFVLEETAPTLIQLRREGYLFEQVMAAPQDKLAYFSAFKAAQLQQACQAQGVAPGKTKQDTIDKMIASGKDFNLPKAVIIAPQLNEWLRQLTRRYVEAVQENADRFHPAYHQPIWEAALEGCDMPLVQDLIQEKLDSKYWLKNMTS